MTDEIKNINEEESGEEYLSQEGFEKLKQELQFLKTEKRKEIAEKLEQAKSLGDLSENSEYNQTKDEQSFNEERISELEDILSRASIISKTKTRPSAVAVGSTIFVKRAGSEKTDRYFIVGSPEADPINSKISNESPLGSAFIGSKKGDIVKVTTPKGVVEYHVVDII